MRVAVDHAVAAEREPPRGEHRLPDAVALLERRGLVAEQFGAVEPVEREQPAGRELRPHRRHAHQIDAGEHRLIERDVLGLALIVELLAHARGDLLGDLAGVDHRVHAAVDREQPVELLQVRFDRRLHVGILELDGEPLAVGRARAMHLAERGGGGRLVLEFGELFLPAGAKLRRHAPLDEGPAHRRGVALQLLQFLDVFGRQQIREWSPSAGRPS